MAGMDLKHFVVTDEIGDTGESIAITPVDQQMRKVNSVWNKNEPRILCTHCNVKVVSSTWNTHILTKNHMKKAGLPNPDAYDERDLYVDESTNAYKTIIGSKRPLAGLLRAAECFCGDCLIGGGEYVVTEKSSGETLCVLCKAQLKDALTIIDHLRSQKHINSFVTKHCPEIYRAIQRKAKSKEETQQMLVKCMDDLVRDFGKKEPLVHEKGFYRNLTALKQKAIDDRLKAREVELNEQKTIKLHEIGLKRANRPSTREKSPKRAERRHSSRSSPSRRRRRSRSDSRSPRRSRSRSPRRHRSPSARSYSRDREHHRMVPRSRSPQHRTPKWRSPPPTSSLTDNRGRQERDRGGGGGLFVSSPRHQNESSPDRGELSIDELEDLPTEPDLFEILCNCDLVDLSEGDRAYIQDILDSLQSDTLIGVDFVAEYIDPRGTYEPGYLCSLCQSRMNPSQAVKHIVGERHALTFLKKFYNKQFTALCIGTLSDDIRSQMKHRYLSEICKIEGRTVIAQRINLRPEQRLVFRHHKRVAPSILISRPFGRSSDELDESYEKPPLYSLAAQKAQELADIEKELSPYCEKNLEEGWYSIRKKSPDYFRRFADPDALYYSIRNPEGPVTDFYGDWNPLLMRRLQDKFNFKLEHIKWLQRLLTQWQIPVYSPLQKSDLRPLEQEVESAVLNELLDQLLKPVAPLRYMQIFQYESYPEKTQHKPALTSSDNETIDISKPVALRKPLQIVPKSDKDRTLLAMIDQVLTQARSQQHTKQNPVLHMLVGFEDARAMLFALATKQPMQLQQLVGLIKDETLVSIPPDKLEALRKRLSDVAEEARREQEAAERVELQARETQLRQRRDQIEQTRKELLRAVHSVEPKPIGVKAPLPKVQSFTPKIPGQKGFGLSR